MKFTAQQIATKLEGTVDGDPDVEVFQLSKIEEAQKGSLTFLSNPKYKPYIYKTQASITIVDRILLLKMTYPLRLFVSQMLMTLLQFCWISIIRLKLAKRAFLKAL